MAQFGEILAELRQDHKLTQRDLAKMLYVTDGTISNYENGVHFPDVEKLSTLADYFHVSTDYLLGRCTAKLSPDVLDEELVGGRTVGSIIQDLREMTPERRGALSVILNDMKLGMVIGRYSSGGRA